MNQTSTPACTCSYSGHAVGDRFAPTYPYNRRESTGCAVRLEILCRSERMFTYMTRRRRGFTFTIRTANSRNPSSWLLKRFPFIGHRDSFGCTHLRHLNGQTCQRKLGNSEKGKCSDFVVDIVEPNRLLRPAATRVTTSLCP